MMPSRKFRHVAPAAEVSVLFHRGQEVDPLYGLEIPTCPHEAHEELGVFKTGELAVQVKGQALLRTASLALGLLANMNPAHSLCTSVHHRAM